MSGDQQRPLQRPSPNLLQAQALRIIRDAIVDGRFAQGGRLTELEISRELGISRGPVREAIRTLEEEGLVESSPYRSARVVQLTSRDVVEIMEIRALLEPFATQRAVERSHGTLRSDLRVAMSEMLEAAKEGDVTAASRAHTSFHGLFYQHSNNRLLQRIWQRVEAPVRLYLRLQQSMFGSLEQVARDHNRMLELVDAAKVDDLRRETDKHVSLHLERLTALADEQTAQQAPGERHDRGPRRSR